MATWNFTIKERKRQWINEKERQRMCLSSVQALGSESDRFGKAGNRIKRAFAMGLMNEL